MDHLLLLFQNIQVLLQISPLYNMYFLNYNNIQFYLDLYLMLFNNVIQLLHNHLSYNNNLPYYILILHFNLNDLFLHILL